MLITIKHYKERETERQYKRVNNSEKITIMTDKGKNKLKKSNIQEVLLRLWIQRGNQNKNCHSKKKKHFIKRTDYFAKI